MKRIFIIIFVSICFSGCCSYRTCRNGTYAWYWKNEIYESFGDLGNYSVYDFESPFKGVTEDTESLAAHYKILLPPIKELERTENIGNNRLFLYTKHRGIAIIQDDNWNNWKTIDKNGLREISEDSVDDKLFEFTSCSIKIKIKKNRRHYMYVDNEIKIIMFNLTENDYYSFVTFPLKNFTIKRRGEIRARKKL